MIASALLAAALASPQAKAPTPPKTQPSAAKAITVAGYLPGWRFNQVQPDRLKGVTDLIIHSVSVTENGEVDFGDMDWGPLRKFREAKNRLGYRMWISVGGWGKSGGFAATAKSLDKRKRFLDEAWFLMQKEGFDGIEIDWKHPRGQQELADFALLAADARRFFAPKKRMVGATIPSWVSMPSSVFRDLDRIFLASYDYQGQHATIPQAQSDIDQMIRQGAPSSKIILGLPFYGRSLTDWSKAVGYSEIVRQHNPSRDLDEAGGIWFNGPATLQRKVAIARERSLAGVSIWELGQDASGEASLLKAVLEAAQIGAASTARAMPRPLPESTATPARASTKNEKSNSRRIRPAGNGTRRTP